MINESILMGGGLVAAGGFLMSRASGVLSTISTAVKNRVMYSVTFDDSTNRKLFDGIYNLLQKTTKSRQNFLAAKTNDDNVELTTFPSGTSWFFYKKSLIFVSVSKKDIDGLDNPRITISLKTFSNKRDIIAEFIKEAYKSKQCFNKETYELYMFSSSGYWQCLTKKTRRK